MNPGYLFYLAVFPMNTAVNHENTASSEGPALSSHTLPSALYLRIFKVRAGSLQHRSFCWILANGNSHLPCCQQTRGDSNSAAFFTGKSEIPFQECSSVLDLFSPSLQHERSSLQQTSRHSTKGENSTSQDSNSHHSLIPIQINSEASR